MKHLGKFLLATLFAASSLVHGTPAATNPIHHVVVFYMENHTFDNVLGYWCTQTARCQGMPATVRLRNGTVVVPSQATDLVPVIGHSVASQRLAVNAGKMDGWAGVGGCSTYACISGFVPSQIPNLTGLASGFAVSDATFSMADSPSWGSHVYIVAGTNDNFTGDNPVPPIPRPVGWVQGPGWGCNSNLVVPWIDPVTKARSMQAACIPDEALSLANGGAFQPTTAQYVPTIMDRVQAAGLDWRIYANGPNASRGTCPSFAECLYTSQHQNMVGSAQLLTDAAAGRLPAFSLILPGPTVSQHNGFSMAVGDNWIGAGVAAIENGPQWANTTIFITYDDCGCFYDHVRPGVNPDGTKQGIRMPMVIVSPYARAGFTDSTPTTLVGVLAYVEHTFSLPALAVNDAAAYDFANSFDYLQPPLAPVRMRQQKVATVVPPSDQAEDVT